MQPFDAKRISPSPAAANPRKLEVGTGAGHRKKKIVTLSHSPRPVPCGPLIALEKSEAGAGGGGEQLGCAARGAQGTSPRNRVSQQ